jgi:hypothetical protein
MSIAVLSRLLDSYRPVERRDTSIEGRARRVIFGLRRGYRREAWRAGE